MIQDPNPTDYPHLESFTDWLYEHIEELPSDIEALKRRFTHDWEHMWRETQINFDKMEARAIHADKLAEALRVVRTQIKKSAVSDMVQRCVDAALAAYEKEVGQ